MATNRNLWAGILIALILHAFSTAEVRLPSIIGENMVLQQKSHVAIWGWAQPGEAVAVKGSWGGLFNFAKNFSGHSIKFF